LLSGPWSKKLLGIQANSVPMAPIYTIVVSTADVASVNIRDRLFELAAWEKLPPGEYTVYRNGNFLMVEIGDYHVYQDGLDDRLAELRPGVLIFASKHRSKENRKTLTVHFTGNVAEGKFGGRPGELATPAPYVAASLLKSLKTELSPFAVSYEATHHGPSSLKVPSVYVEIGSTMDEWSDRDAGRIVARAILGIKEEPEMPVFVGIGGNHYAPRETALALEVGVAFGHIIADHLVPRLTEDVLRQAFEKSDTRHPGVEQAMAEVPPAGRGREVPGPAPENQGHAAPGRGAIGVQARPV
jgi:D-tyrosyl-tRNA(Tyr) deacylase